MQSLKEYLFASGILETGTPEEIEAAKKEYRRQYLREKLREFRAKHRTVAIAFPQKDVRLFEKNAAYHQMDLAAYVKASVYAYANQGFILPDNAQVQKLELLLRRIGNNVNQLTRMAHSYDLSYPEALRAVQQQVNKLEAELSQQLRKPVNLEKAIRSEIQRNPAFLNRLRHLVNHLHVHQDDPT